MILISYELSMFGCFVFVFRRRPLLVIVVYKPSIFRLAPQSENSFDSQFTDLCVQLSLRS